MTRNTHSLEDLPGVPFLYLPDSNVMVNVPKIALITFEGPPESPSCTIHLEGDIPALSLHGKDVERLTATLHIDYQAMQTDLQQAQSMRKIPEN